MEDPIAEGLIERFVRNPEGLGAAERRAVEQLLSRSEAARVLLAFFQEFYAAQREIARKQWPLAESLRSY